MAELMEKLHKVSGEVSVNHSFHCLLKLRDASVNLESIYRLHPGRYLNDDVISFYCVFLSKIKYSDHADDFIIFSTFFYQSLVKMCDPDAEFNIKKVQRPKDVNIFKKKLVLIPVNVRGCHWILLVICLANLIPRTFGYRVVDRAANEAERDTELDVSVSSVHTSELSSFEDEISLSSEDENTGTKKKLSLKAWLSNNTIPTSNVPNSKCNTDPILQTDMTCDSSSDVEIIEEVSRKQTSKCVKSMTKKKEADKVTHKEEMYIHNRESDKESDVSVGNVSLVNSVHTSDNFSPDDDVSLFSEEENNGTKKKLSLKESSSVPENVGRYPLRDKRGRENRPGLLIFDSLGAKTPDVFKNIKRYLNEEYKRVYGIDVDLRQLSEYYVEVARQDNLSDCGIMMLQNIELVLENMMVYPTFPPHLIYKTEKPLIDRVELMRLIVNAIIEARRT